MASFYSFIESAIHFEFCYLGERFLFRKKEIKIQTMKTGIAYTCPISNFQPIVLYPSEAGSITVIIQTIK